MSEQHTQGRIHAVDVNGGGCLGLISNERDSLLTVDEDNFAYVYNAQDARRLAACWNACEQASTEDLETHGQLWTNAFVMNANMAKELTEARALLSESLTTEDDIGVAERIYNFLKGNMP